MPVSPSSQKNLVKKTNIRCKHPSFTCSPTPLNDGIFTFTLGTHIYSFPINNLKQNRISKFNIEQTKANNFFFP